MKFRNYCLVVMGNTKDILYEIIKISESKPNLLDAKGVAIATFTSNIEPRELSDYFKLNNRTFLIFDLNPDNSGYNFMKDEIHEGLFGFLRYMNDDDLREKTNNLIQEISSTTKNTGITSLRGKKAHFTLDEIEEMSPKEKNVLMNKLIDKGVENLSDEDKKLLDKLVS